VYRTVTPSPRRALGLPGTGEAIRSTQSIWTGCVNRTRSLRTARRNALQIEVIGRAEPGARHSEQGCHEQANEAPEGDGRDPAPPDGGPLAVVNAGQTSTIGSKGGALEMPSISVPHPGKVALRQDLVRPLLRGGFGRGLYLQPRPRQDVSHLSISLVARVFEDRTHGRKQRHLCSPGRPSSTVNSSEAGCLPTTRDEAVEDEIGNDTQNNRDKEDRPPAPADR
jgi:hypothetical protein